MKRIIWLGSSYSDLLAFPKDAKQDAGYSNAVRNLSIGSQCRVLERVLERFAYEYRLIYLAQQEEGIYVLHSFVKKTQKTSKKDLD